MLTNYILYLLIEVVLFMGLLNTLPHNQRLRKLLGDRALDIAVGVIFAYGVYAIGATLLLTISKVI